MMELEGNTCSAIINWDKERAQYQACTKQTYLMTAAVGPYHRNTHAAYIKHAHMMFETGDFDTYAALDMLSRTRALLAKTIEADAEAVGLAPNTSFGMNVIAMMLKASMDSQKSVVMPNDEFPSSSIPFYHHGLCVRQVPTANLMEQVNADTGAVVCSAVQFATGYRHDLVAMGEELSRRGIPLIVNATQALGAVPISVKKAKISALTATCHKWVCGGYGLSAFYASREFRERSPWPLAGWISVADPAAMQPGPPTLNRGSEAVQLGTLPFATIAGVEAALKTLQALGIENINQRNLQLTDYLVEKLQEKTRAAFLTKRDRGGPHSINSGIVSIKAQDPGELETRLTKQKIYVTARRGALRIAVHYFNNQDDLDNLVAQLQHLEGSF